MKIGRNDPCHCGSGKKYKKCHAAQDEAARSAELVAQTEVRAKEAAAADAAAAETDDKAAPPTKGSGQRPDSEGAPRPKQKGFSAAKLPRRGAV